MPLLMCPNCQAEMKSINRTGVEFDMCPACRGVWLDRGELEKIIAFEREAIQHDVAHEDPRPSRDTGSDRRRWNDEDDDVRHPQRRRGFSLFDMFD